MAVKFRHAATSQANGGLGGGDRSGQTKHGLAELRSCRGGKHAFGVGGVFIAWARQSGQLGSERLFATSLADSIA